jgi:DNA polymerase
MSLFQQHVERWGNCRECPLCEDRSRVMLARGSIPCDALFVGESPGESEDALGRLFCGPAGHLMDSIIDNAMPTPRLSWAFTNLVCCIPREGGGKTVEPPGHAIIAC